MLQADKQVLLAGVKQQALELRQKELDFNVERYTNLATQASVVAGFSFESLVELEVPEDCPWLLSSAYFVCGSCAMALSLYCLCVGSFATVFGHRLALQGPHGSLERAVHILVAHRNHLFFVAGLSLVFLVFAAVLMSWIKMGAAASVVSCVFIAFAVAVARVMNSMVHLFEIPESMLVTGAVRVNAGNNPLGAIDLSQLNPGSRAAVYAAMKAQGSKPGNAPRVSKDGYSQLHDDQHSHVGSTHHSTHHNTHHNTHHQPTIRRQLSPVGSEASHHAPCHCPPSAHGGSLPPMDNSSHGAPRSVSRDGQSPGEANSKREHSRSRITRGLSSIAHHAASTLPHSSKRHEQHVNDTRETAGLHHEGYLFKKGEHGHFGHSETPRRRYFVLQGHYLYYFKSWEDYGSSGVNGAVNHSHPIDMFKYTPYLLQQASDGANRFDLVPRDDPLARKWELQAVSGDELRDWLAALRAACGHDNREHAEESTEILPSVSKR